MVDVGIFHNGSTNLPLKKNEETGHLYPDATVSEVHEDTRQVVKDQIRHGVLADEYGYDRAFFTEHHFEITGNEFSTNPLNSQMAVAPQTDDIRLCQIANILPWHDPIRLAEQTALLDVVSGGRVEVGIGRGYQPREAEVLGETYFGGGVMNQEKNRVVFNEKYELLKMAWTEERFSYSGEYHHIPPSHTKHHHPMEYQYLSDEVTEYDVEDYLDWDEVGDIYSDEGRVMTSTTTTANALSVFPQPVQKPHPQLWQPVISPRSVKWAAGQGINGMITLGPRSRIEPVVETYYEAAEAAGWPDHRPEYDGEPFDYGWDEQRQRGLALYRMVFNTDVADEETFERWKQGVEFVWDWLVYTYSPQLLLDLDEKEEQELRDRQDLDEDQYLRADFELIREKQIAISGTAEEIFDELASIKENVGFEGFNVVPFFEAGSITGEEADEQLRAFAEDVLPYLEDEYPSP